MYERSINYIDYFENNERVKNIGFLKWESDGWKHSIQMKVTGLSRSDNMLTNIATEKGELLGKIEIIEGRGEYVGEFKGEQIGIDNIDIAMVNNLYLQFSPLRCGVVHWKRVGQKKKEKEIVEDKCNVSKVKKEKKQYNVVDESAILNKAEKIVNENNVEKECAESNQSIEMAKNELREPFYENKWEQLCHTYQIVHPFKGGQDYLSISPKEFVIFREPYQKLVNNSFLLHGYYNYHHIIVGKMMKAGREVYYLGVPGVYYDREKMAAEVFGFEGFESVEKEIKNGSFGYYLRRVEL